MPHNAMQAQAPAYQPGPMYPIDEVVANCITSDEQQRNALRERNLGLRLLYAGELLHLLRPLIYVLLLRRQTRRWVLSWAKLSFLSSLKLGYYFHTLQSCI